MLGLFQKLKRRSKPAGSLALLARHDLYPSGLVHVGASEGQEFEHYKDVREAIYIEPIPEVFARLEKRLTKPGHRAVQALCSDAEEYVEFNIASNNGQSSSMFDLGRHAGLYPDIGYVRSIRIKTRRLDSILSEYSFRGDFLVMDVQGAELKVLRGATTHLPQFRAIYSEVAEEPLYDGGCALDQIVAFLKPFGFRMKHLDIGPKTWGDALFIRTP